MFTWLIGLGAAAIIISVMAFAGRKATKVAAVSSPVETTDIRIENRYKDHTAVHMLMRNTVGPATVPQMALIFDSADLARLAISGSVGRFAISGDGAWIRSFSDGGAAAVFDVADSRLYLSALNAILEALPIDTKIRGGYARNLQMSDEVACLRRLRVTNAFKSQALTVWHDSSLEEIIDAVAKYSDCQRIAIDPHT